MNWIRFRATVQIGLACFLMSIFGQPMAVFSAGLDNGPWPIFGHDTRHTSQSPYIGFPAGLLKWRSKITASVFSSPVIGSDGTVYVANTNTWSMDPEPQYLYAFNNDGTLKWSCLTESIVFYSSPVIGTDGTIYVGSTDHYLYALNGDGSLKWQYLTGGTFSSSPAIGSDGTVYMGSDDNYLYAINSDGSLKWHYLTGDDILNSPAIDTGGTVYLRGRGVLKFITY